MDTPEPHAIAYARQILATVKGAEGSDTIARFLLTTALEGLLKELDATEK